MISAQIPKQAHITSKTGVPITTKTKFGAMGEELRVIKSRGNPIAAHTGQSLFAGDSCAASTIYLNARSMRPLATPLVQLYRKADA
jgi:hypothetical protein